MVVEPLPLSLEGIRAALLGQKSYLIAGESSDEVEALRAAERLQPDVALVDVDAPTIDVARLAPRLHAMGIGVVALSADEGRRAVVRVLQVGCRGYLCQRDASPPALIRTLDVVVSGSHHVSTTARMALAEGTSSRSHRARGLTRRESQVLGLVADGWSSREIGRWLGVSPRTVESHRFNMIRKLGLRRAQELISYARTAGLLATLPAEASASGADASRR